MIAGNAQPSVHVEQPLQPPPSPPSPAPRTDSAARECPTVLLMDNFSAHAQDDVQDELRRVGCQPIMLPANMTAALQPLDVSINRSFKAHIRAAFMAHLADLPRHTANTPPTRQQVARWILAAWNQVSADTIRKAWRRAVFDVIECVAAGAAAEPVPNDEDEDESEASEDEDDDGFDVLQDAPIGPEDGALEVVEAVEWETVDDVDDEVD